jgi:hypothetical protein
MSDQASNILNIASQPTLTAESTFGLDMFDILKSDDFASLDEDLVLNKSREQVKALLGGTSGGGE